MLHSQVQLGVPAIWLKTPDVYRAQEIVLSFENKDFYSLLPDTGFSMYKDNTWKSVPVLAPSPVNPEEMCERVVYDLSLAFPYLQEQVDKFNRPVSFLQIVNTKPDQLMMIFGQLVYSGHKKYRDGFWNNGSSTFPIQFIFISSFDVPEGYENAFYNCAVDVPDRHELLMIFRHIYNSSSSLSAKITANQEKQVVDSGLGLSETSFINLCMLSLNDRGFVDSDYIYSEKMKEIKQKGILEIIKPKITFDDIGGLDNAKNLILKNAALWRDPEKAKTYGIRPISRILTVGVPGTGKSAICEATASALNIDLARTGISQVMNSFVGQSEANMRAVFQQIKVMAPLCVWIDEFGRDLSGGSSSSHVDAGTTDRVHGEFLTGLQELPSNVFLMCAANQIENLRPEMLRAERFDKIMFVGLPTLEERIAIVKIYLSDVASENFYSYEEIADATKYMTGAEIKSLIKEVKFNVALNEERVATTRDIVQHVPRMRNILWNKNRQMVQDLYSIALEQWDWASTEQFEEASSIVGGVLRNGNTANTESKSDFSWSSKRR